MQVTATHAAIIVALYNLLETAVAHVSREFRGTVGAENYTYYELREPGNIQLSLESLHGDADLYISVSNKEPTYEVYDINSVTCGLDLVDIGEELERPISIGVYGHPSYDKSRFSLEVILFDRVQQGRKSAYSQSQSAKAHLNTKPDEEESIFATIILGILKLILDILL